MEGLTYVVTTIALLLGIFFTGMPVAFAIGILVLFYSAFLWGPQSFALMGLIPFAVSTNYNFLCIPLFILMSELLLKADIGRDLFSAAEDWLGWVPGGIAISTAGSCALSGSVIGVSLANTAIVGRVAFPEMEKRKYSQSLSSGVICSAGTLGILIPPSIQFVMYGTIAEESIGRLFLAGIFPGIVLASLIAVAVFIWAMIRPADAPLSRVSFSLKKAIKGTLRITPIISLALGMLVFLYTGITGPTEVAALGVCASLLIMWFYKKLNWLNLKDALLSTVQTSCMIMWIIVSATMFTHILAYTGIGTQMTNLSSLPFNKYIIIVAINLVLLIMGCLVDPSTMVLLGTPVFVPIIKALGFDPVWFGVIFVLNMELGYITPPFGMNLFIMDKVTPGVSLGTIIRGTTPFIICIAVTIALIIIFPNIALFLPSWQMGR